MNRRTTIGVMCLAMTIVMGLCHVASAAKKDAEVPLTAQGAWGTVSKSGGVSYEMPMAIIILATPPSLHPDLPEVGRDLSFVNCHLSMYNATVDK